MEYARRGDCCKSKPDPRAWSGDSAAAKPVRIDDVEHTSVQRFPVPDYEFARVLGGGIVPGSVTLLGGEPGIGKSTLLLQLALSFTGTVAYISGEESPSQIKLRGERIGKAVSELYLLSETKTEAIFNHLKNVRPHLVYCRFYPNLTRSSCGEHAGFGGPNPRERRELH